MLINRFNFFCLLKKISPTFFDVHTQFCQGYCTMKGALSGLLVGNIWQCPYLLIQHMHFEDTLLSGNTCIQTFSCCSSIYSPTQAPLNNVRITVKSRRTWKAPRTKEILGDQLLSLIFFSWHLRFSLQVFPILLFLLTCFSGLSIVSDFTPCQTQLAGGSLQHHSGIQADGDSIPIVCFFNHCASGKATWRIVQWHLLLKDLPRSDTCYCCSHFTGQSQLTPK